jgi:hypothetical protein
MFFNKNKEIKYFRYSTEKKVEFYFNIFIGQFRKNSPCVRSFKSEIKQLLFDELDSFCFGNNYLYPNGKYGARKLQSELGHLTNNWSIDWSWIVHHIILDYRNIGVAQNLLKKGLDKKILVYKYVPDKYYDFAKRIYLKNIETKEPRIFELTQLMKNGHGLHPIIKEYKPLVGTTLWKGFNNDFWDLTELRTIKDEYIWNADKRMFVLKPYERKIERESKIIITIENKRYEV